MSKEYLEITMEYILRVKIINTVGDLTCKALRLGEGQRAALLDILGQITPVTQLEDGTIGAILDFGNQRQDVDVGELGQQGDLILQLLVGPTAFGLFQDHLLQENIINY